jgi:hypothetical protein
MSAEDDNTDSGTACAESVRSALSTTSSLLERLISVTSLKDPYTGGYKELALKFSRVEVDHVLGVEHKAIFEAWLRLSLQEQTLELAHYVSNQQVPGRAVLGEWTHQKSYQRLIPPGAMPVQHQLFVTAIETILRILAAQDPAQP